MTYHDDFTCDGGCGGLPCDGRYDPRRVSVVGWIADLLDVVPRTRAERWGLGVAAAFCATYGPLSTWGPEVWAWMGTHDPLPYAVGTIALLASWLIASLMVQGSKVDNHRPSIGPPAPSRPSPTVKIIR